MTTLADRTIEMLRTNHDRILALVAPLSDADLDRTSGSADWDVAQVLSHLGSQAEIGRAGLERTLAGLPPHGPEFNEAVWARWNAKTQREKADDAMVSSTAYLEAYEALDPDTRASLSFTYGFLPFPADLALVTGLRLNEVVMHAWDLRFAFDPAAAIPSDEAAVLLEQLTGPLSFLAGFLGHVDTLDGASAVVLVEATEPAVRFGLALGDRGSLSDAPEQPDAVVTGTLDAVLRLIEGRMPADGAGAPLTVVGDVVTLDLMRRVFPGF